MPALGPLLHDDGPDTALARALLVAAAAPVEELRAALDEVRASRAAGKSPGLLVVLIERGVVSAAALDAAVAALRVPAATPRVAEARRCGPYRLVRELARGGMGVVHEAVHEPTGVRRALKSVLPVPGEELVEAVARFRREATALARLDHPHIVPIHEAQLEGPAPWLTEDLLPGGTLGDRLEAGPLPPGEAVEVCLKLAGALAHAHAHGIVHRDLKPGNVMFDAHAQPRLVDFGLARDLDVTTRLTASDTIMGTPAYMAPEQARGAETDARTDVYALGAILHALLAGKPPYSGPPIAVLHAVLRGPPAPLERRDLPSGLTDVVARAMERDPAKRYPRMVELEADLAQLRAAATPEATRLAAGARRARGRALLAGAALALGAGALLLALVTRSQRTAAWEADLSAAWSRVDSARSGFRGVRSGVEATPPSALELALAEVEALLLDPRASSGAPATDRARLARVRSLCAAEAALSRGDSAAVASALAGLPSSDPDVGLLQGLLALRAGDPAAALERLGGIPAQSEPRLVEELRVARDRAELWVEIAAIASEVEAATASLDPVLRLAQRFEDLAADPIPQDGRLLERPFTILCLRAAELDGEAALRAVERALMAHLGRPGGPVGLPDAAQLLRCSDAVREGHRAALLAAWARWVEPDTAMPNDLLAEISELAFKESPFADWLQVNLDRTRLGAAPIARADPERLQEAHQALTARDEWYARLLHAEVLRELHHALGPADGAIERVRRAHDLAAAAASARGVFPRARAQAEFTRGACAWTLSLWVEAARAFERAFELGHGKPDECLRQLSQCRHQLGDLEGAAAAAGLAVEWADRRWTASRRLDADALFRGRRPATTLDYTRTGRPVELARMQALEIAALQRRAADVGRLEQELASIEFRLEGQPTIAACKAILRCHSADAEDALRDLHAGSDPRVARELVRLLEPVPAGPLREKTAKLLEWARGQR